MSLWAFKTLTLRQDIRFVCTSDTSIKSLLFSAFRKKSLAIWSNDSSQKIQIQTTKILLVTTIRSVGQEIAECVWWSMMSTLAERSFGRSKIGCLAPWLPFSGRTLSSLFTRKTIQICYSTCLALKSGSCPKQELRWKNSHKKMEFGSFKMKVPKKLPPKPLSRWTRKELKSLKTEFVRFWWPADPQLLPRLQTSGTPHWLALWLTSEKRWCTLNLCLICLLNVRIKSKQGLKLDSTPRCQVVSLQLFFSHLKNSVDLVCSAWVIFWSHKVTSDSANKLMLVFHISVQACHTRKTNLFLISIGTSSLGRVNMSIPKESGLSTLWKGKKLLPRTGV